MFPIVILQRAGTPGLDGKYSIHGRLNECYKFIHNENPSLQIVRIYYDAGEDEAVWVIRKEKTAEEIKQELLAITLQKDKEKMQQEEEFKQQQIEKEKENANEIESGNISPTQNEIVDANWLLSLLKSADMSRLDVSGNRTINIKEFSEYFFKSGVNNIISQRIFKTLDKNGNGTITAFDFLQFRAPLTAEKLRDLLPEFCPKPFSVLRAEEEAKKKEEQLKQEAEQRRIKEEEEERQRQEEEKRRKEEESRMTLQKLQAKTFKELKDLCVENNIPPHGTRAQLLNKLEAKLFPPSNDKSKNKSAETSAGNNYQPSVVVVGGDNLKKEDDETDNKNKEDKKIENTSLNKKENNENKKKIQMIVQLLI